MPMRMISGLRISASRSFQSALTAGAFTAPSSADTDVNFSASPAAGADVDFTFPSTADAGETTFFASISLAIFCTQA